MPSGKQPPLKPGPSKPSALEVAGQQAAQARHAGLVVLAELNYAHRLIALLLRELSPAGMARFAKASEDDGIGTDGAIRHHERAAALALAHSSTLAQPGAQHG